MTLILQSVVKQSENDLDIQSVAEQSKNDLESDMWNLAQG